MTLEILGEKTVRVDGYIQVDYKTGKTVIYCSETTKHLVLNPGSITAVVVSEKKKII